MRVPDLANLLDVIIVLENQENKIEPQKDGKTRVLGADAFSELKWRVSVSLGIGWDATGEIALLGSISAGAGTVGVGVGAFYAIYDTPSISNVSGVSFEIGGGFDIPGASIGVAGLSFGVDQSFALASDSFTGQIYSLTAGLSTPLPVEGHFQFTATGNISEGFKTLLRMILGNDATDKTSDYVYGAS